MIEELGRNKYKFTVNIGSGAARRRVSKTITHKGGKKALQNLYDEFEAQAMQKPLPDVTVGEMLDSHVAYTEALGRKATTMRGYRACVKRLDERFKAIKAKDLTAYHIEKEIARMTKSGLSAKTVRNTIGVLSAAFDHAIYTKQFTENPCKYVSIPTGKKREIRILYKDEIQPFLYALADADLNDKVGFELALFMGLRRSEILGLKESDVDIVRRLLYVHNTRHRVEDKDIDQDTKTKRSTRVLALPDILVMDIAALLKVHADFKYEKTDYLIQDGFGNIVNPSTFSARLRRLEETHNLPHVTVQGLRHTYASLLNNAGVDMARISAELGHSTLATTMNIYTHIFEEASQSSRGIAQTINDLPELSSRE